MASGFVCRANRPNTWPHRQACKREESPCQLGAVHTWHFEASAAERYDRRRAAGGAGVFPSRARNRYRYGR